MRLGLILLLISVLFVAGCTTGQVTDQTTTTSIAEEGATLTTLKSTTSTTMSQQTTTTISPIVITSTTIAPEEQTTTTTEPTTTTMQATFVISRVIDGDTIEMSNDDKVRLLGINTPERGQFYYTEATERLRELVDGKSVILEKDISNKDQYGRLLRYIHIDNIFVNLEMVEGGYANAYFISPNTKYINLFTEAEIVAKNAKIGIWQSSDLSKCIGISYFHWNAEGNDCNNLNDEYVIFSNSCSYSISLNDWTVKDEATHIYTFSDFTLAAVSTVSLYTGSGTDTSTELYWSSSGKPCNAIWNNDGDTLYLRDEEGKLALSYYYP